MKREMFYKIQIYFVLTGIVILSGCEMSSDRITYKPDEIIYYETGEVKVKEFDFLVFGYYYEYYKSGNISFVSRTVNGLFNGYSEEYSEDREILWKGIYEDSIRYYPHERYKTFVETEFIVKPDFPDTITEQSDTIYFKILTPYHLDDFTTLAQTAYHKFYRTQNAYSIIPFDTVPSGYIRLGVINEDFTEWKFIDSIYFNNRMI